LKGKKKISEINVIVHSTGGLVIRHWVAHYYGHRIDECPVKRIVMLAPANFGSPLAHRGKSFLGRLVKGRWKIGDFLEVGRNLLNGLELASPYQWQLADRDVIRGDKSWYNRDQIQLTILTGREDYAGLRGWVNKPGTDGTIVIAGSSINSVMLKLDFSDPDTPCEWKQIKTGHDFSFGVIPGLDHGTIVGDFEKESGEIIDLTVEALKIKNSKQFGQYQKKLNALTKSAYDGEDGKKYHKYQQFLIRARDDHGAPIEDYTLEFCVYKVEKASNQLISEQTYFNKTERRFSDRFQKILLCEVHTYSKNPSYRRLLVDIDHLGELVSETREAMGDFVLIMKIFVPEIDKGIYYDIDSLQNIVVYSSTEKSDDSEYPNLFYSNTTTLLELEVNRKTRYVRIGKNPKN